jgi:hypothetical protein
MYIKLVITRDKTNVLRICPGRSANYQGATMAWRHSGQTRGSSCRYRIPDARGKSFRTIGDKPTRQQGLVMDRALKTDPRQVSTGLSWPAQLVRSFAVSQAGRIHLVLRFVMNLSIRALVFRLPGYPSARPESRCLAA